MAQAVLKTICIMAQARLVTNILLQGIACAITKNVCERNFWPMKMAIDKKLNITRPNSVFQD